MSHIASTYGDNNLSLAIYESNDHRLKGKTLLIEGVYKKLRSIKGIANGMEEGIFTTNDNEIYIVFIDWTIRKPTPTEKIKINETLNKI